MPDKPLVSVFIDGQEVRVPQGTNIIEAAKSVGVEIPHYCYHSHLSVPGNCRMCLTEMGMEMKDKATGQTVLDENGKPKVSWIPRPQIACATNAAAGQHFKTTSPMVKDSRNSVMEFLLINHPLDCPICDQAGECHLQEFATEYGRGTSRFTEEKNHKPKRTRLGPRVTLDDERCILCSRCVRFTKEIVKDDVLGFVDRGSYSTLTCYPGMELKNNYSLNTVDICPVGALTSTDFRFKMRVWFLKETQSICTESSVGVNTTVSSREGKIYRITPRRNDEVNDTWMSDSGREIYKTVEDPKRLLKGTANASEAILKACGNNARIALVVSAKMSLEEQFLVARMAKLMRVKRIDTLSHIGEGDGLLISADRTPNMRGLFLTGLINEYPKTSLKGLKADLREKKVDVVVAIREDIVAAGISPDELKNVTLIAMDSHHTLTTDLAQIVQPVGTVFERSGSFVNQQWRVQKFLQAVPNAAEGVSTDIAFIDGLLQKMGEPMLPAPTPEAVWKLMATTISTLKGTAYATLPATGILLDGSAWGSVSWPEGKTLHYEGKAVAASNT
jgi:NADH-quinone oxidoreductase subunit G